MSHNLASRHCALTRASLHVGTSPHFWNKENRAPSRHLCKQHTFAARYDDPNAPAVYDQCWAFSRFQTTEQTAEQFIADRLNGLAWIPSTFKGDGRRTNENWQRAELIAIDYDNNVSVADCLAVPLIRDFAMLVHPSATSGKLDNDGKPIYKTRVIFRLDTAITGNVEDYRLSTIALCRLLGLPDDACSYKPAQLFYGSTNRIEQPHVNTHALLPMTLINAQVECLHIEAEARRIEAERKRAERNYQPIAKDGDRASHRITRLLEQAYQKVVSAPSDRTKAAYDQAFSLAHYLTYWNISESDIERTLLDALQANGAVDKYGRPECLRHIGNGIKAGLSGLPEPLELPDRPALGQTCQKTTNGSHREVQRLSDQPTCELDYTQPEPLTLRQAGRWMVVCPEYVLLEKHALKMGNTGGFTVAEMMESIGVSHATAQRIIDRALAIGAISERFAELKRIDSADKSILFKNEKRQIRGAAVARRYSLTPDRAEHELSRRLPDYVQELMEWGAPDVIRRDEAEAAGVDDPEALEAVTEEVAQSLDAYEVSADAERAALKISRELDWYAESDDTPFTPDVLPGSITELRVQLIEALIATRPNQEWRHGVLMWVAGVKRTSVSALIRKSKFKPADAPTYVDVKLEGKDLHRAVRAQCREKGGAPVAWLDAQGRVLSEFNRTVPIGAKGVKLNIGKTYTRREQLPISGDQLGGVPENEAVGSPLDKPPTEAEEAAATERRERLRAQRGMTLRMRGCVKARGWRYVPGPYGYWERGGISYLNTFDGMASALLDDREWAEQQREIRRREVEPLIVRAIQLGAIVEAL